MLTRKLIAYGLIALIVLLLASWTWQRQRRQRKLLEERYGPRPD